MVTRYTSTGHVFQRLDHSFNFKFRGHCSDSCAASESQSLSGSGPRSPHVKFVPLSPKPFRNCVQLHSIVPMPFAGTMLRRGLPLLVRGGGGGSAPSRPAALLARSWSGQAERQSPAQDDKPIPVDIKVPVSC